MVFGLTLIYRYSIWFHLIYLDTNLILLDQFFFVLYLCMYFGILVFSFPGRNWECPLCPKHTRRSCYRWRLQEDRRCCWFAIWERPSCQRKKCSQQWRKQLTRVDLLRILSLSVFLSIRSLSPLSHLSSSSCFNHTHKYTFTHSLSHSHLHNHTHSHTHIYIITLTLTLTFT